MNMELLTNQSVLFAAFGGLSMQLINLMELRHVPKMQRPDFKDIIYWLPFFIAPLLGGVLALAYISQDEILKPLLSINVGASAPLALKAMANINPLDKKGIDPGVGA